MTVRRTLTAQIQEVEREIGHRRRLYPTLIATRKMRQAEADEHLLRMRCVLDTLRWLEANEARIKGALL